MAEEPTDEQRRRVYGSLLRGMAQKAQDQLCHADVQHAWGEWTCYHLQHDDEDLHPSFDAEPIQYREVRTAAARTCLNCGKVQRQ